VIGRGLQIGKAGRAFLPDGTELAVNVSGPRRQLYERRGNALVLRSPVQAGAREESGLLVSDAGMQPVAVEFELVRPFVAGGRGLREQG
jgi:hypothetical protein